MNEAAKWTEYYSRLDSLMAPNEYLLKMLLGRYAGKVDLLGDASWRTAFRGRRVLDMSCGDGRNIVLLHKLGFDISATEISDEICDSVHRNLANSGIDLARDRLRTGSNAVVPFDSTSFDFVISWNAVYYLDDESDTIDRALGEVARVLQPGGWFICSVPGPRCYSVLGAHPLGGSRVRLEPAVNADWGGGLQKDAIYHLFQDPAAVGHLLAPMFEPVQVSELHWDGFGVPLHYFIFAARRRPG